MFGLQIHRSLDKYVAALLLFAFIFLPFNSIVAAPAQDNALGTYTDDFAGNTGLATSNQGVKADAADGKLKLNNNGGTFTAPLKTTGYAITNTIMPTKIARWGTLTMTRNVPAGTAITVQVLDDGNAIAQNKRLLRDQF
jgi:hypothetical protein